MTENEIDSKDLIDGTFDSLVWPENEIHFICFTSTPNKSKMYPPKYLVRLQQKYGIELHIIENLFSSNNHLLESIIDSHIPTVCFEASFWIPSNSEKTSVQWKIAREGNKILRIDISSWQIN